MFNFLSLLLNIFYLNGKNYLPVSRLSSVESRLPPPVHVVEVNRAVKLLFLSVIQIYQKSEVIVKRYIIQNGIYRRFTKKD